MGGGGGGGEHVHVKECVHECERERGGCMHVCLCAHVCVLGGGGGYVYVI